MQKKDPGPGGCPSSCSSPNNIKLDIVQRIMTDSSGTWRKISRVVREKHSLSLLVVILAWLKAFGT